MSEEKIFEALVDFATAVEASCVQLKQAIATLTGVKEPTAVKEENFTVLKYEKQTGSRIGDFEVASKNGNVAENFEHARKILEQAGATISKRYHGPNYAYSYWLFQDRIFRQALKRQS